MLRKLTNEAGVVYNVEQVRHNKLPRHFFDTDRENKLMSINGKKVKVMINRERTQYVGFQLQEKKSDGTEYTQSYYVRDHSFFDNDKLISVVKSQPEANGQPAEQKAK